MPLGSWYSQLPAFGWFDPEDRPGSAAYQVGGRSIPNSRQGIALPTRGGLGKWYNVTPPGGNRPFPMQQTDIGPAKYTGRGVDISAAGAHQMGYTPKNFPTDARFKVEPIDLTGLGLAAGYQGGVPGDNQTAVAEGPPPPSRGQATQQGRKMPTSLMDMFQPRDPAGDPSSFGDAVTSRSNSLIGLGLGLLSPSNPLRGQSSWGQGLEGFQAGAQIDARTGAAAAERRQRAAEAAMARSQHAADRAQAQSNFERQFARSDPAKAVTEAQRAYRDIYGVPGTPDYKGTPETQQEFFKQFYLPKTEGDWQLSTDPNGNQFWANKRTQQTKPVDIPGGAAPGNPYSSGSKMSTDEGKTALFADRAATAHEIITKHENINEGVTGKLGGAVEMIVPAGAANMIVSPERALAMNAKRAFVNSLLRRESGAVISAGEFANYDKEYFSQPGDTKEQIDFKRKHRAEVIAGLARESGRGYRPDFSFSDTGHMSRTGTTPSYAGKGKSETPAAKDNKPDPFGLR